MKPGATMQPLASTTAAPSAGRSAPMATIRSSSMRTSAVRRGAPVPSMTVPPRTSNGTPLERFVGPVMSKERPNCAGDPIIISDGQQQPPFVERRARMRDSAADKVAYVQVCVLRNPEIGVLIVHRGDFPIIGRGMRQLAAAGAKVPRRDGQVEVE